MYLLTERRQCKLNSISKINRQHDRCHNFFNHYLWRIIIKSTQQAVAYAMPRIGDKAPSFTAVTTQGEINFPEQYAGSWVVFSVILLILHQSVPRNL
jgi:hypothetical protein